MIRGFNWFFDGKYIVIFYMLDFLINFFFDVDIVLVEVVIKEFKFLISNLSVDFFEKWFFDGKVFFYGLVLDNWIFNYYENNKIFIYNLFDGFFWQVGDDFDEDIYGLEWKKMGIFVRVNWCIIIKLFWIDLKSGKILVIEGVLEQLGGFILFVDGSKMVFFVFDGKGLREVFMVKVVDMKLEKLISYIQ